MPNEKQKETITMLIERRAKDVIDNIAIAFNITRAAVVTEMVEVWLDCMGRDIEKEISQEIEDIAKKIEQINTVVKGASEKAKEDEKIAKECELGFVYMAKKKKELEYDLEHLKRHRDTMYKNFVIMRGYRPIEEINKMIEDMAEKYYNQKC